MRAVFGLLAIVIALAAVGYSAQRQLRAADVGAASRAAAARAQAGPSPAEPVAVSAASAPNGLSGVERDVRDRTAEALRQGAERNAEADR